jgi:hypothetical protein
MMTFFAPPLRWAAALSLVVKTPVDSTMYCTQMSTGLNGQEEGGCLYLGTALCPGDVCGVSLAIDINVLAVNHELAALGVDIALELAVGGIVLEHVDPGYQPSAHRT